MNVTITQNNGIIEHLGAKGEFVINKLYELAIDNPDINLSGFIFSLNAIGSKTDYLNQRFEGNLIIRATNRNLGIDSWKAHKTILNRITLKIKIINYAFRNKTI